MDTDMNDGVLFGDEPDGAPQAGKTAIRDALIRHALAVLEDTASDGRHQMFAGMVLRSPAMHAQSVAAAVAAIPDPESAASGGASPLDAKVERVFQAHAQLLEDVRAPTDVNLEREEMLEGVALALDDSASASDRAAMRARLRERLPERPEKGRR